MSKVIKNNDGVAVVEGTPAASLVKDVDKFFASKPPERMAGESVSQPRTIDQTIKTSEKKRMVTPARGRRPSLENLSAEEQEEIIARRMEIMEDRRARDTEPVEESAIRSGRKREVDDLVKQQVKEEAEGRGRRGVGFTNTKVVRPAPGVMVRRKDAKDKAESRRKRFFERRRSRKEAERSQTEQEATRGKFITTLER